MKLLLLPKNLKSYAILCLTGAITLGLGPVIAVVIDLFVMIPGLDNLLMGIGALVTAFAFGKHPQLAFVLPSKALRLTVIETKGGTSLFNHTWSKMDDLIDDTLFSGMMHAISQFVEESLRKGDISEIIVKEATLIVERSKDFNIACVLIVTKSTASLRNALDCFAEQFFTEFSQFFSELHRVDHFKPAIKLIEECFPFVPEYD